MAVISMGEPPSPSLRRTPAKQQQQLQQRSELTHISPNTGRISSPSNKRTRMKASMSRGVVAATDDTAGTTEADENRDPLEIQERPMGPKALSRKHRYSSEPPMYAMAEMRTAAVASTSAVPYDGIDAANAVDQAENTHRRKRRRKGVLHVEVSLLQSAKSRRPRIDKLRQAILDFIEANFDSLLPDSLIVDWEESPLLSQYIAFIKVAESTLQSDIVYLRDVRLQIHIYCPSQAFVVDSFSAAPPGESGEAEPGSEDSDVMAATVAMLPSVALEGIWDNLIYEDDVKTRLLNYIQSTQMLGDKQVDFNIITWNRVVLLHGPPGTGKTSLCRALAQKLAIRLSHRYTQGKLVEINSHSIMSKWFSESGKLVQRLFTHVLELVEDETCFVVVLIDEVESLTAARAGAMSGKEPSDAVRVVNALLTQLDKLKNKKNVLVMTTSNLSGAIDSAFIDRADIKQYIGLPPVQAVYWIMLGCLRELMRSGVIIEAELLDWKCLQSCMAGYTPEGVEPRSVNNSMQLLRLSEACHGMSGRSLRRIPLLAHVRYVANGTLPSLAQPLSGAPTSFSINGHNGSDSSSDIDDTESLEMWLAAMLEAAKQEKAQLAKVDEHRFDGS